MKARLQAAGSTKIDERRFTIFGEILAGEITAKQYAKIPLGEDSENLAAIDSVELMDRVREEISYVGLVFNNLDDAAVEMIESAKIEGGTILISDSTNLMALETVEWYSPDDPTPRQ